MASGDIPHERESCVSELPMPLPPVQPSEQAEYHRCMPDATMQISFAILPDGKLWSWRDYSDPYAGMFEGLFCYSAIFIGAVSGVIVASFVSWRNRRAAVA